MERILDRIAKIAAGVRTKVQSLYLSPVGHLLPTRQVLGASVAGLLATFLDEVVPGLEVSDALLGGIAAAAVAWLLGPPKVGDVETFQLVPPGQTVGLISNETFDAAVAVADAEVAPEPAPGAAGAPSLPEVEGEFVGPENDDTEPGRIGFT